MGDLDSLYRLNSDGDRQRRVLGDGLAEEEIIETEREDLSGRVAEEIAFRAKALGEGYPFEVRAAPFQISTKSDVSTPARSAYVFMLLMSGYTFGLFNKNGTVNAAIDAGRRLFHLCASFGVAGLLRHGRTHWFGFPRPDKSNFAAALDALAKEIGYAAAHVPAPAGLPEKAKDDQVDVLGWREFGDRRIGTMFVVCQAATGADWDSKSVLNHLDAFLDWFERAPYRVAMPSLAVPFLGHHEVTEPGSDAPFETATFNALRRLHGRHGVILDRLRITESIPALMEDAGAAGRVAGHADVGNLHAWVQTFRPMILATA
uniref:hypothetical protein n=1 Tax=uncultured Caulobacter sp. TaxID=158749 RepID=UPI0025E949B2|nr:hypothetical protein [uncultured Caulobacter sp.]